MERIQIPIGQLRRPKLGISIAGIHEEFILNPASVF
jgi:hypothetical protein